MSEPNTSDTMSSDSFASILSPQLFSNTDAFLTLVRGAIYEAPSPLAATRRFPLKSLTVQKNVVLLSQHESSSTCFKDREKLNSELLLFVERNASTNPSPLANNKSTLGSIKKAPDSLDNRTTSSSTESLIPLLPMNPSDESSEFGRSFPTGASLPGPTFLQRVGLTSTQGLGVVHGSFVEAHDAEDRILGTAFCDESKGSYGHGRVVREIILPDDTEFTILDLAILVHAIHRVAPIYSLFENHCYWFVRILSDCIVVIIGSKCIVRDQGGDRDMDSEPYRPPSNRPLPPSSYLPSALCGTWKGILVNQVKDDVMRSVLLEFQKQRAIEMGEIHRRQTVLDEHARREVEVGELRREALVRDGELSSLRSGMSAVQSELLALQRKLHSLGISESGLNHTAEMQSSSVSQI